MSRFDYDLQELMASEVKRVVCRRLEEFRSVFESGEEQWFSELCFCLLTANAKQRTAAAVQQELGFDGFMRASVEVLVECLKRNKHRFHNNKARWIALARAHTPIKQRVTSSLKSSSARVVRDELARDVKGMGLKEASHFLRNVGVFDVAIIDRHILRVLLRYRLIRAIPSSLSEKKYRYIEGRLQKIACRYGMSLGELDLYMWYMNTGVVLK